MGYRSKNAIIVKSALVVGDPMSPAAAAGVGTALQPDVTTTDVRPNTKPLVIQPRDVHPWQRPTGGVFITGGPVTTNFTFADVATGVGAGRQPSARIDATAARATGTGAANNATVGVSGNISVAAGRATGTGTALLSGVTTPGHTSVAAGIAVGTGAARNTTVTAVGRPPGFTHATVTRDYDLADGSPPTGTVYFTPSTWLLNYGVTVPAATVAAPLDTTGKLTISLVSNADTATTPPGSYYTVREVIDGQSERTYQITIPSDVLGFTVDLGYLEVVDPPSGTGYGLVGYGLGGYGD